MLHIENLWVRRGANYRVQLPQLHLARGQVKAIIGASGCGKSTLLEMLGLILHPHGLQRFYLHPGNTPTGLDVAAWLASGQEQRLAAVRARHIGFVLQSGGLLPFLTVQQNIQLPRRLLGLPAKCDWISQTVEHLDLVPLLHRKPGQLSIGERQRVAFVRAIAHRPALLLADEPTAALDPLQAKRLFSLIIETVQQFNIAALLVSHDWALVKACAIPTLYGQPLYSSNGTVFTDAPV